MTNLVLPINSNRIFEKGLNVQFFDKIRQITNEDGETVDILDENNKQIIESYIEISSSGDLYTIVCRRIKNQHLRFTNDKGFTKKISYPDFYPNAWANYLKLKEQTIQENLNSKSKDLKIRELEEKNKELEVKNKEKSKKEKDKNLVEKDLVIKEPLI
jgi:hypothetical protein